ncbi:MAG TPA: 30S ribosomal protein S9 [Candidatus Paceibacterota bacterium]
MATKSKPSGLYYEAVGRRKTSVARVRLLPSANGGTFVINDKSVDRYFPTRELHNIAHDALVSTRSEKLFNISAHIHGGGIHSQAEALRHGMARALVKADHEHRKTLKRLGYLTRDSRAKERRKFGLKKARKAPQWAKR